MAARKYESGTWMPVLVPKSSRLIAVLLVLCSIVTSTTFGYDGSMINGLNILPSYINYFHLDTATIGLQTSSVFIGGCIAGLTWGKLTDILGRRPALFWAAVITLIAVLLQTAAQNIAMFVIARILIGLGTGASGLTGPAYLAETLPLHWRGWGLGIFNDCYYVESPRWLVYQNENAAALTVVAQTYANGDTTSPIVLAAYKEIVDTISYEKNVGETLSLAQLFKTRVARKRVLLACSAAVFSTIAGNVIASYYLATMLTNAGITDTTTQLQINVILNAWCLVCSVVGTWTIDIWGRKPTAIVCTVALTIFLFIVGALTKVYGNSDSHSGVYGTVAAIFLFQGSYSFGWTPLLYMYPPEVLNYPVRANGLGVFQFVANGVALLIVFTMPISLANIGWKTYMINGAWDVVIVGLLAYYWVETKGKTLEEIDQVLEGTKHSDVPDLEMIYKGKEEMSASVVTEIRADQKYE
ncbi:MAG: hypothetical protein M1821_009264 [Bathelium mastoideum]|nr:MAG: hypothetical protein M1821_009264 [Bathelium mastoideum]